MVIEDVNEGNGLTVKLLVAKACDLHPAVLVPITVKDVLLGGLTTALPPCMVYVFAPLGLMVKFCPAQIEPEFTIIIGLTFTIKLLVATACDTQPAVLVPATVKLELLNGLTTAFPPCMVYVFAPLGLIVKFCPAQIEPEFTLMVGLGFTVIVI